MRSLDEIASQSWPSEAARRAWTAGHADAFAPLNVGGSALWEAIRARFELAIAEANDAATHPDTEEVKRAGWAARERGLRDLFTELADLRSGAWKRWPEVETARPCKAPDEEQEERS